ncbi:tol-pal system protein YbgF [Thioalkalivibrio sp. XN8]|uniref:tol-pal system protein YbgF n=1 Tax=Thioalkalivibrio sp. XN8 TaxID=2712863 RepID=UPI0013EB420B|nr:tol-pal system protein YbgF [Thioalkalivibrio sp. XN8]NGP54762.1 tol-pal system protein YbgF [Thioalkalivibrio sp. XN8]
MKILKPCLALVAAALVGGCILPPEEDPVLLKLDELDQRVGTIERVVRNESLLRIASELEILREEVRELRGATEALEYEAENAATRQRDQYLDLDQRLQSLERRTRAGDDALPPAVLPPGGEPVPGAVVAGPAPAPSGSDQASYQAALELLRQGRYPQAEEGFRRFLADFPDSALIDNAIYWLAETYYVNRDFDTALATFQRVLEEHPNSRKAPDALLKAGFCQYELKQFDAAQATLESVVAQYPDSTAARLATQRLERIAAERR